PGLLSSSRVTSTPGSTLFVELTGPASGTQYDQFSVIGSVTLSTTAPGVTLAGSRLTSFVPTTGTPFTIVNNDLGDGVAGTFTPAGSVVIGGVTFSISYTGGDGNDIVLTTAAPGTVYVDDNWAGTATGANPANDPIGGLVFGYNAFADIPSAIPQAAAAGTVVVFGGSYGTAVNISKPLTAIDVAVNPGIPSETTVAINGTVTLTNNAVF